MTQAKNLNTTNLSWGTARAPNRRSFIGGSDARIVMGQDEKALSAGGTRNDASRAIRAFLASAQPRGRTPKVGEKPRCAI
jgi:hypothetical protein